MAKIKAPLFSLDASGTLDKTLTYRKKPHNNTASKYAKPGDVNPFESSPRQKDQRSIIGLITACWQSKTSIDQLAWNNAAKDARFKGTGYHYFLHLAKTDLKTYLGLVGFWSMNYNVGDKIPDLSEQNNYGTLSPIYPCDCPQPVDSFNKKHGKALYFNGITNYLSVLHNPDLNPSSSFTLSSWVCFKDITNTRMLINKGNITIGNMFYSRIQFGVLYFAVKDGTNQVILTISAPSILANVFYYISVVKNYTNVKIYLNGELKDSGTNPALGSVTTTDDLYIGKDIRGHSYLSGIVDDTVIYNRALSRQEIQRYYNLLI